MSKKARSHRIITTSKRAQDALAESQENLKAILDAAPDGILLADIETKTFRLANSSICQMLGYSRKELLCLGVSDIHPKEELRRVIQAFERQVKGDLVIASDVVVKRKDGSTFFVDVNAKRLSFGGRVCLLGIFRDVTERKRADALLKTSETQYRRLFEAARDGILILDAVTGMVVDVNPFLVQLLGFSHDAFLGKKVWELGFFRDVIANQANFAELQQKGYVRYDDMALETSHGRRIAVEFVSNVYMVNHQKVIQCNFRDITELKRADEKIRSLSRFPEENPNPVLRISEDGTILHANKASAPLLTQWGRMIDQKAPDDWQRRIAASLESGTQSEIELDHNQQILSFILAPVLAEKYVNIYCYNITERKMAERKLKLFRELIDHSFDSIYVTDPATGRFLDINDSACRELGYSRDELLGMSVLDLTLGYDRKMFMASVEKSRADGLTTVTTVVRRKDGSTYTAEMNVSHASLDRDYVLAIARNITERKQVEESHTRLAIAVEQCAEMIVITDSKGTILYVNPAFEKITGYTCAEALGKNPRLLKSGKHNVDFYRQIWTVLKRSNVWHGHIVNKRKDGTLYEADATISTVRNEKERIVNYVSVQRDVSHEMQLESQLRQAQKMEAIGQLAGGVAHDFNNLLTVINGRSQLLMLGFKPGEKIRSDLELIYKTGERAASLTRQLLAFSRQQILQPVVLDLNVVVGNLDKLLRRLIREDIELTTILDPTLKRVRADPAQIEQVIVNLVVNSRDAMPDGGTVTIETANVELSEKYVRAYPFTKSGRYVMLAVSDTGHGMDATVKARVFEPFFTTKPAGKGTGLGLATVFGIVKQSEGHINVYSEVGKGTTFKVYLPEILERTASTAKESGSAMSVGNEVILVVEDEEGVREFVRDVLTMSGYTVLVAQNGRQALSIFNEHKETINLVLTDVVMPEMGGPELAERIKASHPKTKVLFASGYTDHTIVRNGMLDSGCAFIQKPITPANLALKVRQELDRA